MRIMKNLSILFILFALNNINAQSNSHKISLDELNGMVLNTSMSELKSNLNSISKDSNVLVSAKFLNDPCLLFGKNNILIQLNDNVIFDGVLERFVELNIPMIYLDIPSDIKVYVESDDNIVYRFWNSMMTYTISEDSGILFAFLVGDVETYIPFMIEVN